MRVNKRAYLAAKKTVAGYESQQNKSLVKDKTCICCKKMVIKVMPSMGEPPALQQGQGPWLDGTVSIISFGYGSRYDMSQYYIAICDDCIESLIREGLAEDYSKLQKKLTELLAPKAKNGYLKKLGKNP